jgi:hypothetical protein
MKRRLAAILVADTVGYGRRMGEDEVGDARPGASGPTFFFSGWRAHEIM